ncbi:MAG TPA: 16S rRNA (cytosine(1402)-N(4))-methyltransferase RsmH [Candidatus Eisenbacteria bacterium]|nr:16S rRNA (cytosine(1402)-N(4))-methyltransferase RsmH [Candidatus Eisenbacteria bacterium]
MPGHVPVLLREAVRLLITDPRGVYVDATLGGGGHSVAILHEASESRVIGMDCDEAAVARARRTPPALAPRFTAVRARFSDLEAALATLGVAEVDGILADLGLSSIQLDDPGRGLSYDREGPLDMRLDPTRRESADALIARSSDDEIAEWLAVYGELPRARVAARAIRRRRHESGPLTTRSLREALEPLYHGPARPRRLAQAFQAIRIAVNREIDELQSLLDAATRVVRPGGTMVVIAYHSLEDRLVKRTFRPPLPLDAWAEPAPCPWEPLTPKPVRPGEEEIRENPRAASAKLRAARRVPGVPPVPPREEA